MFYNPVYLELESFSLDFLRFRFKTVLCLACACIIKHQDDLEETESTGKRRKVPRATKAHLKRAIKRKIGRDQRQFEVEEEHELDNPETRA